MTAFRHLSCPTCFSCTHDEEINPIVHELARCFGIICPAARGDYANGADAVGAGESLQSAVSHAGWSALSDRLCRHGDGAGDEIS